MSLVAAIPYHTFPNIGPLFTFGLMVALGMIAGAYLGGERARHWGLPQERVYNVAVWMFVAGVLGARLTWVVTHWDDIESPIDVIAIWEGGLQFGGGFTAAVLVLLWKTRAWSRLARWRFLDAGALGVSMGILIGRIGCIAVGEHLGGPTDFFLGMRYEGGVTLEGPLVEGVTYHNTAFYELLWLIPVTALLAWLSRRRTLAPSLITGVFLVLYSVGRFSFDFLRIYDEKVLGLTGAQYMCLALFPAGIWLLATARRRAAALLGDDWEQVDNTQPFEAPALAPERSS